NVPRLGGRRLRTESKLQLTGRPERAHDWWSISWQSSNGLLKRDLALHLRKAASSQVSTPSQGRLSCHLPLRLDTAAPRATLKDDDAVASNGSSASIRS